MASFHKYHRPNPKDALREFLSELHLPAGMLSSVYANYQACDSRLWLLDNSSFMKTRDSHVGRIAEDDNGIIERIDDVSRWQELSEAVAFHAKMSSKCWMPTKFWLINEPSSSSSPSNNGNGHQHQHELLNRKFTLCWQSPKDVPHEMSTIKTIMQSSTILDQAHCQLTPRLASLTKGIEKAQHTLSSNGKVITVVICTQGTPTNSRGQSGSTIRKEFQQELYALSRLPVKVIIRLTTDDEQVKEMYNTMDARFDCCDVLDDYWGEAMEVYLHNPWLTYSVGLHRLREAGLGPNLVDDLDERPLSLDEIHQLCTELFVGDDGAIKLPMPPRQPTRRESMRRMSWKCDWQPFMTTLKILVQKEPLQWNPIKKNMTPWINVEKIEKNLFDQFCETSSQSEWHTDGSEQSSPYYQQRSYHYQESNGGSTSDRHTPQYGENRHNHQTYHNNGRHDPPHRSESCPDNKPTPPRPRRASGVPQSPRMQRMMSGNRTAATMGRDLTEVLKDWSHQPPSFKSMYPLQRLLVTVPRTFPPNNPVVEEHEYFAKWKRLDKEAFADVHGEELKELLKRAVRKAKFFLHPDKLPKDLTENQTTLFKTLWEVIMERESRLG